MKQVLVIHEIDLEDDEHIIIGVSDSIEKAEQIIKDYYGKFKEISYQDIRDSNLEYLKILELKGAFDKPYKVKVWLEWFILNKA